MKKWEWGGGKLQFKLYPSGGLLESKIKINAEQFQLVCVHVMMLKIQVTQ